MKKLMKAIAALMLTGAVVCTAGCTKTDEPNVNNPEVEINYVEGSYVDFDLPSGTLWGTVNLGGTKPEDYGHYFAWGEIRERDEYNWAHYQFAKGYDYNDPQLTKYCSSENYGFEGYTDTLTTLLPEDDAATSYGDSTWCMPTEAQWKELYENCYINETTLNGVNGIAITRNGKSIFLPATGRRWNGYIQFRGKTCYYWSSTLHFQTYNAIQFWFETGTGSTAGLERPYGLAIRPVRSDKFTR